MTRRRARLLQLAATVMVISTPLILRLSER